MDENDLTKQRYSFTLPPDLIEKIDDAKDRLSMNRSMVVREALTHWLEHRTKNIDITGDGLAVLSYIYDHHEQKVLSEIINVQHDFESLITSTINVSISHHQRFEFNICKGNLQKIKQIVDELRKIKGIFTLTENYYQE